MLLLLLLALPTLAAHTHFHVVGDDPGPWPRVLRALGMQQGQGEPTTGLGLVVVLPAGSQPTPELWRPRIEEGALVVLEGASPLAASLGFVPEEGRKIPVRHTRDVHQPQLPILWQDTLSLPRVRLPAAATVFAREKWENVPLLAGLRVGKGAVLWLATGPGAQGYERFPYLPQALRDLGWQVPFRSARLWAFFDTAYRSRADVEYLARRWRQAGIAGLHVAAWQHHEADAQRDDYLRRLIAACHRNAILVYAWLELPHVSEAFWRDHPEWREKTAVGQDAHLDWRKLMNLQNADCQRAVAAGVHALLGRFDWDGVNLAELYFESLEGASNPARFTPLNADVRRRFEAEAGFDPLTLFDPASPRHLSRDPQSLTRFLNFRATLAEEMQRHWLGEIAVVQQAKPHLDVVLTHVDDRYDPRTRDLIGADAARVLPLLDERPFTFLVEDPATLWHLGPERYPQLAERYKPITPRPERLAIDINVVERYQDVYPTKQQTGVELFQLIHLASRAFPRVALYFENSLLPVDQPLLAAAAAVVDRVEQVGDRRVVQAPHGVQVPWRGPALVNGRPWPASDGEWLLLPPGAHAIETATTPVPVRLLDFNGDLQTAASLPRGVEFSYRSGARAVALLDQRPVRVEIDGEPSAIAPIPAPGGHVLLLPRGQHLVTVITAPAGSTERAKAVLAQPAPVAFQ